LKKSRKFAGSATRCRRAGFHAALAESLEMPQKAQNGDAPAPQQEAGGSDQKNGGSDRDTIDRS
jgi:hypothetical protein